jgi:preprotein translocase subunit YajC
MSIGPVEVGILIVMVLCSLVVPIVVMVAFISLFRRQDKLEQELRQMQSNIIPNEENPPGSI